MGILDFFGNKRSKPTREVEPGVFLSRRLAPYWPQWRATRIPYVQIEATPAYNLSFAQSKFGGPTLLPKHFPYPVDSDGQKMFPLAQLNFSEIPPLEGYPTRGWLQFYISTNDDYGIHFTKRTLQKNFRVLYFEEMDMNNIRTDFDFMHDQRMYDKSPVSMQHALSFAHAEECVGVYDIRFEKAFGMDARKFAAGFGKRSSPAVHEELFLQFPNTGHKIGGYAYFADEDPRVNPEYRQDIENFQDYILLLQIDSVSDDTIMWANRGACNFFIRPDHLRKKDFSSVAYNWDTQDEQIDPSKIQ
ncbi:MAG TPA: DUF1963 domain-containing protein [Chitinophagaceae bacterium]|nr:DUF1963 domain-containing protein [Chitinophagaceae bacterium]